MPTRVAMPPSNSAVFEQDHVVDEFLGTSLFSGNTQVQPKKHKALASDENTKHSNKQKHAMIELMIEFTQTQSTKKSSTSNTETGPLERHSRYTNTKQTDR